MEAYIFCVLSSVGWLVSGFPGKQLGVKWEVSQAAFEKLLDQTLRARGKVLGGSWRSSVSEMGEGADPPSIHVLLGGQVSWKGR